MGLGFLKTNLRPSLCWLIIPSTEFVTRQLLIGKNMAKCKLCIQITLSAEAWNKLGITKKIFVEGPTNSRLGPKQILQVSIRVSENP